MLGDKGNGMMVRPYHEADLGSVVALLRESVHNLAAPFYTGPQLEAWAPESPDLEKWRARFKCVHTLLALDRTDIAGFVSFEMNGHIDLLYVHPNYARQGVASALLLRVERALPNVELFAEASMAAHPFFLHHGFHVTEEASVVVRGASFRQYLMRRSVVAQQADPGEDPASRGPT
jgi:putative acetyltransferase